MSIYLPPELEKLVDAEVATGRFGSANEVIREGLRLVSAERRWQEGVRRKIADGMAQAEAGELVDGNEVFERLRLQIDSHRL